MAIKKDYSGRFAEGAGRHKGYIRPANMNQTVFLSRHCYDPTKRKVLIFLLRFESKKSGGVR